MAYVAAGAVVVDTRGMEETLRDLRQDQVPYAMQLAVNNLAKDTIRIEKIEMQQAFDRPTPFVLRGLRVAKWAKKKDPTAAIWFKDVFGRHGEAVENTLRPQIEGGRRNVKSSERRLRQIGILRQGEWLVAVDSATNVYGNIPGPEYQRMLSYFRAYGEAGYNANRRAGQSASAKGLRYFVQKVGKGRGIFRVRGRGKPKLLWYITSNTPSYRKRFDFYGEADRHAKKFGGYFASKAMKRALATAR